MKKRVRIPEYLPPFQEEGPTQTCYKPIHLLSHCSVTPRRGKQAPVTPTLSLRGAMLHDSNTNP